MVADSRRKHFTSRSFTFWHQYYETYFTVPFRIQTRTTPHVEKTSHLALLLIKRKIVQRFSSRGIKCIFLLLRVTVSSGIHLDEIFSSSVYRTSPHHTAPTAAIIQHVRNGQFSHIYENTFLGRSSHAVSSVIRKKKIQDFRDYISSN